MANITESDNICGKKVSEKPKQNIPNIPQHTKKIAAPIQKPYTNMVKKNCKNANTKNTAIDFITEKSVLVPFVILPPIFRLLCFSEFFILSLAV